MWHHLLWDGAPSLYGPWGDILCLYSQEGLHDLRNEKYVVSFFFFAVLTLFFFLFYFFSFFLIGEKRSTTLNCSFIFYLRSSLLLPLSYLGVSAHREHIYLPSQWKITSVGSEYPILGITQRPDSSRTWMKNTVKDPSNFRTYDSVKIWHFFLNIRQNHMTFSIAYNRELVQIGFKVGRGGFITSCKVR